MSIVTMLDLAFPDSLGHGLRNRDEDIQVLALARWVRRRTRPQLVRAGLDRDKALKAQHCFSQLGAAYTVFELICEIESDLRWFGVSHAERGYVGRCGHFCKSSFGGQAVCHRIFRSF